MGKKEQISAQLSDDTLKKIKSIQTLDSSLASRNNVLETAVNFYFGYLTSELSQDYLCAVIGSKISGMLNTSTDRSSRLQFKEAVEINLLTRLIASNFDIDKMTYDKMRKIAVNDVKATKGIINIYDASNNIK